MNKSKRLVYSLIFVLIISMQCIAFASSSDITVVDVDGSKVSVELDFGTKFKNKFVGIEVINPGKNVSEISSEEDVIGTFAKLDTMVTDNKGIVSGEFSFNAISGNYKFVAECSGKKLETTFPFSNVNEVTKLANDLKNSNMTYDELFNQTAHEDVFSNFETLCLDKAKSYALYSNSTLCNENAKADVTMYFLKDKDTIATSGECADIILSLQTLFDSSVYKSMVINCSDVETITEILSKYSTLIGMDSSVVYKDVYCDNNICDKKIIKAISTYISNKNWTDVEKADFSRTLEKAILLSAISANEVYGEVASIINNSKYILIDAGLDWDAYDKAENKTSIHRDIAAKDADKDGLKFETIEAFAGYLNGKIGEEENNGGSSGSGGSSSSGSGKKTSSNSVSYGGVTTTTPNIAEVKKADLFTDLDSVEWAKEAIYYLAEKEIVNGKSETTFAPNDNITREEIAKILVVAFELSGTETKNFSDVDENSWYYNYVKNVVASGIIEGYGDEFGVGDFVTRQDLATICYRILNKEKVKLDRGELTFLDSNEISDYALNAVKALSKSGIINGMEDGTFNPKGSATRAQAAKIIYNVLLLKEAKQ